MNEMSENKIHLCKYVTPYCPVPENLGPEQQETAQEMAQNIIQKS